MYLFKESECKMNIPYDTGKVKIGINYKPRPYIEEDKDMLLLQTALLYKGFITELKKRLIL
jgi:hypothetical protein